MIIGRSSGYREKGYISKLKTWGLRTGGSLFGLTVVNSLSAADMQQKREALQEIAGFADRICGKIPSEGSEKKDELSGSVRADLLGVIRRLANIGFEGAVKHQRSQYQGVLQGNLAQALKDERDCRRIVFQELKKDLLDNKENPALSEPSERDRSGAMSGQRSPETGMKVIKCKIGQDEFSTTARGGTLLTQEFTQWGVAPYGNGDNVFSRGQRWGYLLRQNDPNCPAIIAPG